jgi:peptidoglycan/xylan/chitin deacetylase (PgdA/CDA1 family)
MYGHRGRSRRDDALRDWFREGRATPSHAVSGTETVNRRATTWADRTLSRSPGQALFRWRASRRLAVLAYHDIDDIDRFEEHIRYIRRWLVPVSLEDVIASWTRATALPRRAVLVTFDDGYPSVLRAAAPVLLEHEVPGVAFVVAGVLDTTQPLWWAEAESLLRAGGAARGFQSGSAVELVQALKRVKNAQRLAGLSDLRRTAAKPARPATQLRASDLVRLESAGIEVGNHTLTHPSLTRCSGGELEDELRSAHDVLTDAIGHPPQTFAYPDGEWDPRTTPILQELGYRLAFTFDHRLSDPRTNHPMRVSRLRMDSHASLDRLRIVATGLHPAIHRIRGGR